MLNIILKRSVNNNILWDRVDIFKSMIIMTMIMVIVTMIIMIMIMVIVTNRQRSCV